MTAWRHLTLADYLRQPWANGRGETLEIARHDGPHGLLWRLSIATVAEDGPFSSLPGIDRNLTVIDGPGFDLTGPDWRRRAAPMAPVTFPGDHPVTASGVTSPSRDFNVMVARGRMRARVAGGHVGRDVRAALVVIHLPQGGGMMLNGRHIRAEACDTITAPGACVILTDAPVLIVALDSVG